MTQSQMSSVFIGHSLETIRLGVVCTFIVNDSRGCDLSGDVYHSHSKLFGLSTTTNRLAI